MTGSHVVPRLSVIVVAFNGGALLQSCLESLEHQTVLDGHEDEVEVLVVVPWGDAVELEDVPTAPEGQTLASRFPRFHWVREPKGSTVPRLRGAGIARSRGQLFAFLEDDCLAPPTWCARLLSSYQGAQGAVGGAVEPGRLTTSLDWAVFFSEYGPFIRPAASEDSQFLPGTNVCYRRCALAELADGVTAVESPIGGEFYEVFVHQALRRRGWRLKIDPDLVVHNAHSWTPARAMESRFHHGRGYAGKRLEGAPLWRRLPYLGLAIVLPIVQVGRICRGAIARRAHVQQLRKALPWLMLCSTSWSVGEFVGYLAGPGNSLHKWR